MPLESGKVLSHYRIDRRIGTGGMGEVWAATDTRLNRAAAIKSLPADLARDPERLARFRREAQLLASLNHPNIAAIYGLEEEAGHSYLAMELVEGEDLATRLESGPLSVEDAIDVATQIAAALGEAHEKGIVHRDLKPANIRMAPGGKVKVLDFGLAKAIAGDAGESGSGDASLSPTLTAAMGTQAGIILGTAGYMSPEQARGKPVDRRADIWAFGVVLYETLTGTRLFTGETVTDVIAQVVTRDPDWGLLPQGTPPGVRRVLRRCLEKDPRRRLRDVGDACLDLEESAAIDETAGNPAMSPEPAPSRRSWRFAAGGVAAGLALAVAAVVFLGPRPLPAAATWSNLLPPEETGFDYKKFMEISPDGRHVVFVASAEDGKGSLWVRDLTTGTSRRLNGTEQATMPFWSPDSGSIGYFADRKLRTISVGGGVPVALCDVGLAPRGGAWGEDGTILYVPDWSHPVFRVPQEGGAAVSVTALDPDRMELSHRWPRFLPDGRHFLYYAVSTYPELNPQNPAEVDKSGLDLGSFDGAPPRLIQTARSRAALAADALLYVDNGILMARPFDARTLAFTGPPRPLAEGVTQSVDALWAGSLFSVSNEGTLLFVQGASEHDPFSRLVWRDRQGKEIGSIGEPAAYGSFALSHDGSRLATSIGDSADVWIFDLARGTSRRFTFDTGNDISPRWSGDDARVIFMSSRVIGGNTFSPANLFVRAASGQEEAVHLISLESLATPSDWSPDGRTVLLDSSRPGSGTDILLYSIEEGTVTTLLSTPQNEEQARFSPDGRLVAYASTESGRWEAYVRTFPEPGGKWQVSSNGGILPMWRADGRELFYLDNDFVLMAVPVDLQGGFSPGAPQRLFRPQVSVVRDNIYKVDAAPDGERFLLLEPVAASDEANATVTLVRSWPAAIPR